LSEIRPAVVDQILTAMTTMDPTALDGLPSITPEERAAAEDLYLAASVAGRDGHDRHLRSIELVLSGGSPWPTPPSWSEAFDVLPESALTELRELYWDLPEGARQEYDRFGRPKEAES
jgi:hypothetical protein